jgi:hypothetical protein
VPLIDPRTGLIDRAWYLFFLSLLNAATIVDDGDLGNDTVSLIASYDAALQALAQSVETQPPPVDLSAELTKQIQEAGLTDQSSALLSQIAEMQKQLEALNLLPPPSLGTVTAVTATAPVVSSGGIAPNISMPAANTSTDGYLTSTDWNTFNNKQPAGTYVTSVAVASSNGFAGTSSGGATPTLTLTTTITGLLKGNGTAISAATSGTDYAPATSGTSILYGNGAGGFSNVTIGTGVSFAGGTLSATGSGGTVTSVTGTSPVVSSGGTTPAISLAIAYGDTLNPYASKTANYVLAAPNGSVGVPTFRALVAADVPGSALTKTDDTNVTLTLGGSPTTALLNAASLTLGWTGQLGISRGGTNTSTAPSAYGVVYGNSAGTAYTSLANGTTGQVLTATTGGAPTWAAPATSGTVTSVSVVSANGFAGTVATATTTPAITLTTSITGILKGNGTAISAAVVNTDYFAPSAPVTKTADFTVAATEVWLINNKSGSTCTTTLPAAASWSGRVLRFQNYQAQTLVSASSNVVPLAGGAAGTSILLASSGDSATLVSDGTNWLMTQYIPNNILLLE